MRDSQLAPRYPTKITDVERMKSKGITSEEIRKDIADAEQEILNLEKMQEAENILAKYHIHFHERRINEHKAASRPSMRDKRRAFAAYLYLLLADRAKNGE